MKETLIKQPLPSHITKSLSKKTRTKSLTNDFGNRNIAFFGWIYSCSLSSFNLVFLACVCLIFYPSFWGVSLRYSCPFIFHLWSAQEVFWRFAVPSICFRGPRGTFRVRRTDILFRDWINCFTFRVPGDCFVWVAYSFVLFTSCSKLLLI